MKINYQTASVRDDWLFCGVYPGSVPSGRHSRLAAGWIFLLLFFGFYLMVTCGYIRTIRD